MYADGRLDQQETLIHPNNSLPKDVMILEKITSIQSFFSSDKDLALASINYPADYSESLQVWLNSFGAEFDLEIRKSKFNQELNKLKNWTLLQPFLKILFEISNHLQFSGCRITVKAIEDQMCPVFHVDNLLLRLITTVQGKGTQWLRSEDVNRRNLGKGGRKPIAKRGAYLQVIQPQQVAIMKGARFPGSSGLVHRSPSIEPGVDETRVIVRFDFTI